MSISALTLQIYLKRWQFKELSQSHRLHTEDTRSLLSYLPTYSAVAASKDATWPTPPYPHAPVSSQPELSPDSQCHWCAPTSRNLPRQRSSHQQSTRLLWPPSCATSNERSTAAYTSSKSTQSRHCGRSRRIHSMSRQAHSMVRRCHSRSHPCCWASHCCLHLPKSDSDCSKLHHASQDTCSHQSCTRPFGSECRRAESSCQCSHWWRRSHLRPSWCCGCRHCGHLNWRYLCQSQSSTLWHLCQSGHPTAISGHWSDWNTQCVQWPNVQIESSRAASQVCCAQGRDKRATWWVCRLSQWRLSAQSSTSPHSRCYQHGDFTVQEWHWSTAIHCH